MGIRSLFALEARLNALEAEVLALRAQLDANPYGAITLPWVSPEIVDRDNIGQAILHDRLERPSYAFCLWLATIQADRLGIPKLQIFEFGVAHGAGLTAICRLCEKITASTDVQFDIYGFDSDVGMPRLADYRDHPEIWRQGQFQSDHDAIRAQLPANAKLISGNIADTLPVFMAETFDPSVPVGFVSIDVDLYSSTQQCIPILRHPDPKTYLPTTIVWMDDINDQLTVNNWTGEELAIVEFNETHSDRKLQELRIRQNHPPRGWHDHVYGLHVLNHPARTGEMPGGLLHRINITAL